MEFFIIIIFSFITSTISSLWILKNNKNKWLGLFVAFIVNSLILSIATISLYNIDVQTFHKQTEGLFCGLGIVFFIPFNTFINYYIMDYRKKGKLGGRFGGPLHCLMKQAEGTLCPLARNLTTGYSIVCF